MRKCASRDPKERSADDFNRLMPKTGPKLLLPFFVHVLFRIVFQFFYLLGQFIQTEGEFARLPPHSLRIVHDDQSK